MKRRGIIIWLIGIGLLGVMSAYLFSQANKNKQELNEQASRNVLLLRENLKESLIALNSELESFVTLKLILNLGDTITKKKTAAEYLGRDPEKFKLSIQKTENKHSSYSIKDSLFLCGIHLQKKLSEIFGENINVDYEILKIFIESENWEGIIKENSLDKIKLETSISFDQWMESSLRESSFFDIVFLANEEGEILFPSSLAGTKVPNEGNTMGESFGKSDVSHFYMEISAAPCDGFVSPLKIGNNILWVGGLKNQKQMDQVAYSIDYNLMVIIALGLVVLLLSLPIISFFDIGKGEILSKSRVYMMGASLVLIFIISGFAIALFLYSPSAIEQEKLRAKKVKKQLECHYKMIKKNLNGKDISKLDTFKSTLIINEEIDVRWNAKLEDLRKNLGDTLKTNHDFSFINLQHRRYFDYFYPKNKTEKNTLQKQYFLERIFSQKNGKPELVMSTKSQNGDKVNAITFTLSDTLKNTNSKGYLLFKEDGEVIFSSERFEFVFTQIRTALPEEKWKSLQALIQSNKNDSNSYFELPLYLNGKEYTALINKFEIGDTDKTIWFVYLVNCNMYHSLTGLMVLECFIWSGLYCILLILISLVKLMTRKSKGYNWESFVYNDLNPKKISLKSLRIGIWFFGVFMIMIFIIYLLLENPNHLKYSFLICGLIAIIFALFNQFILPNSSKFANRVNTNTYSLALFFWFFLIGFLPGFIICSSVFRYENKLWHKVQENQEVLKRDQPTPLQHSPKDDDNIGKFYKIRAKIFSAMDNGFDPLLREMIYPDIKEFATSVGNISGLQEENSSTSSPLIIKLLNFIFLSFLAIGIFMLIKNLVRKIYWTDFDIRGENELGLFVKENLGNCENLRIFLCGFDSRKNRDWIHSHLNLSLNAMEIIDCAKSEFGGDFKSLKQNNKKALYIENIHCVEDMEKFINQIPKWFECTEELHLIFGSGISWRKLAENIKSESSKIQFSEIFSDFYFEIVPITFEVTEVQHSLNVFNEKIIEQYLNSKDKYSKREENPHQRLLLQRYGKAYFYNIWSELSIEEKNICHAYSKEGFFNYKNKEEIIELFQKGVITKDKIGGQLYLFSKTFRYFILSITSEFEMEKLTNYRKRYSNSRNTLWALISFLLVAAGILSYFESSFLTKLESIVTGAIGISTLVITEIRKFLSAKSI